MDSLAQAADRIVGVGKDRSIALLDDEPVEKAQAARIGIEVGRATPAARDRGRRREAFEIHRGRVAGRAGLMVVDEAASLLLLISEEPVCDLERHVGELRVARHLPPLAEGLQQPRDLPEVALVPEAMPVVLKRAAEPFLIDRRDALLAGDGESEQHLAGKVLLVLLEGW